MSGALFLLCGGLGVEQLVSHPANPRFVASARMPREGSPQHEAPADMSPGQVIMSVRVTPSSQPFRMAANAASIKTNGTPNG